MRPGWPLVTAAALMAAGLGASPGPPAGVRICATLDEAVPPGAGPALLVFFSIECAVCYEELFETRYLVDKGGWPVPVIGVALALREDLEIFLEKHGWTAPVVLDRRRVLFRRFKVDAVPDRVLIVGDRAVCRDDTSRVPGARREELEKCLIRLFSH
jgi:hypothetical protein